MKTLFQSVTLSNNSIVFGRPSTRRNGTSNPINLIALRRQSMLLDYNNVDKARLAELWDILFDLGCQFESHIRNGVPLGLRDMGNIYTSFSWRSYTRHDLEKRPRTLQGADYIWFVDDGTGVGPDEIVTVTASRLKSREPFRVVRVSDVPEVRDYDLELVNKYDLVAFERPFEQSLENPPDFGYVHY